MECALYEVRGSEMPYFLSSFLLVFDLWYPSLIMHAHVHAHPCVSETFNAFSSNFGGKQLYFGTSKLMQSVPTVQI